MTTTERAWGHYEILAEGPGFLIKKLTIKPTLAISHQYHNYRSELWYVLEGEAQFTLDGERFTGGPGFVFKVLPSQKHQVRNISYDKDFVAIEIWRGYTLDENDIVRI